MPFRQLFFFDSGPVLPPAKKEESEEDEEVISDAEEDSGDETDETEESSEDEIEKLKKRQEEGYGYGRKPAWEDKDDFTLQVSLTEANRTRKLRETEEEDVVSGVEYEQRLRRQFEKVNPVPSWATLPSLRESRKRRSKAVDGSDSEYSDEEEQHSDFEEDEDVNLLRSTHGILDKRRAAQKLPQKDISIVRLKNANQMNYSQVRIELKKQNITYASNLTYSPNSLLSPPYNSIPILKS
jgi:U3 small nucleolar RNA-associated protein 18